MRHSRNPRPQISIRPHEPQPWLNPRKKTAALIISRVTEPLIWTPLMIGLVLRHVNLPARQALLYYPVLLLFVFVIPFGYFLYLLKVKKEFDMDITQRSKRVPFILRAMVSFAAALVLTRFMNQELFLITAAVFFPTLALVLVTLRWKISFHSGLNTLIFCTVNFIYHGRFWWLYALLIPIAWARLTLRKHTPAQVAAGIVLSGAVFIGVIRFMP